LSMGPAPRTKILVAVIAENEERLRRVLTGHELDFVGTCDEANLLLRGEKFGMVIVGVHFDESQMFTLLADIRAHAKHRKVPILCVLGNRGRLLTEVAIEGLDHAVKAMMANGLLNLLHFDDDAEGNARIRRIVDCMILIDGDLQHIARASGERVEGSLPERGRRAGDPAR
jgi:PleD family two-component response regulator